MTAQNLEPLVKYLQTFIYSYKLHLAMHLQETCLGNSQDLQSFDFKYNIVALSMRVIKG